MRARGVAGGRPLSVEAPDQENIFTSYHYDPTFGSMNAALARQFQQSVAAKTALAV